MCACVFLCFNVISLELKVVEKNESVIEFLSSHRHSNIHNNPISIVSLLNNKQRLQKIIDIRTVTRFLRYFDSSLFSFFGELCTVAFLWVRRRIVFESHQFFGYSFIVQQIPFSCRHSPRHINASINQTAILTICCKSVNKRSEM